MKLIPEDTLGFQHAFTEAPDLFLQILQRLPAEVMKEADTESDDRILERTIEELTCPRSYNCLKRAGINTA